MASSTPSADSQTRWERITTALPRPVLFGQSVFPCTYTRNWLPLLAIYWLGGIN